ncbi:MAG: hypothetical protein LKJ64_03865 [Lentilactobacillus buchneri]|jgi:hypothetical protein|nr:hypothetical protein [Lentilactobacillus buchneri]MCI2019704.1 hypothetical protein [Lentilactobacillus buchneri]MCI2028120.1 hypothetical protein [Lentilactobacillus buchneri]
MNKKRFLKWLVFIVSIMFIAVSVAYAAQVTVSADYDTATGGHIDGDTSGDNKGTGTQRPGATAGAGATTISGSTTATATDTATNVGTGTTAVNSQQTIVNSTNNRMDKSSMTYSNNTVGSPNDTLKSTSNKNVANSEQLSSTPNDSTSNNSTQGSLGTGSTTGVANNSKAQNEKGPYAGNIINVANSAKRKRKTKIISGVHKNLNRINAYHMKDGDALVTYGGKGWKGSSGGFPGHVGLAISSNKILEMPGVPKGKSSAQNARIVSKKKFFKLHVAGTKNEKVVAYRPANERYRKEAVSYAYHHMYKKHNPTYKITGNLYKKSPSYCSKYVYLAYWRGTHHKAVKQKLGFWFISPHKMQTYFVKKPKDVASVRY